MRLSKPALTSLLLLFALPALTQSPQPAPTASTLKIYARETIVDVTVTDAKGNPVHDLKKEDFTLQEDNKPQPIRSFQEYTTEAEPPLPKLPPNIYSNLQPSPIGPINILWLDFTNLAPVLAVACCKKDLTAGPRDLGNATGRQRRVKVAAEKFVQAMPPGTRVAVLGDWYPPGTLRVLQGVTTDPSLLSAAIDTMPFDTDALVNDATADELRETQCAQLQRRNRMTMESLSQMAVDLAQIKGRKNLLWFALGVPTLTDPAQESDPSGGPSCLPDYATDLKRDYGLLAASQVTIFPIGVRDLTALGTGADLLSMESVAEATGGVAYYNSNDYAAQLTKAIGTGSDYYTLSYASPNTAYDGRHHTIKLVADLPNLHLTYRNSYYAEDPATLKPNAGLTIATTLPDSDIPDMKLAMGRSMPTSQQFLFDVEVDPSTIPSKPGDPPVFGTLDPKLKGKPLTRYSFQYDIPALQIEFPRNPDAPDAGPGAIRNGALEVDIAAYDADGKLVTGLSQTIKMPLTTAQYRQFIKSPYQFTQRLDLPSGQLFLRFGVLDPTSGNLGTLEIPLTVPKK